MRILICNYEYPPLGGGGGVVMAALARQLARRHEVTVPTSRAGGLAAQEDDRGVRVVRVPVFFRHQLAVAIFPSMLAYLPSGIGQILGISPRTVEHTIEDVRKKFGVSHRTQAVALAVVSRLVSLNELSD